MTMALKPTNADGMHFDSNIHFWGWLLTKSPVGLVIGCHAHKDPGKFYYEPDENGLCPMYNDGFHVTEDQALAMADAAEKLIPEVTPDYQERLDEFIRFARQSGGFEIF